MTGRSATRLRLSVNILTRTSEDRLERLVSELRCFADEILIGVDATSPDRTYEIACDLADVVYRFRLPGQLSPARMLVFDYATGDWILSIDDDESMEVGFDALLPELMADATINHVWFPRKWLVGLDPAEYLHADPWYPNFALRLFRNDRSIVWKPDYTHSQYYVQGSGRLEERASILHFEMLLNNETTRQYKFDMYRRTSGPSGIEWYAPPPDTPRRPAALRPPRPLLERAHKGVIHSDIRELAPVGLPPWKARFLSVDCPTTARDGELLLAQATVMNTGELAWPRPSTTNHRWPLLNLANHLLDARGEMLEFDRDRIGIPRLVRPGETVTFIFTLRAPSTPGAYLFEWDMVSEGECWFAACGGDVARTKLAVED